MNSYESFSELARMEIEGQDYRRVIIDRESTIAIVAPHGGSIEPGTSEIATAIASDLFSLYILEGIKLRNRVLHIASIHFDDPKCLQITEHARSVLTVHGCGYETSAVHIGGLDERLKMQMVHSLRSYCFKVEIARASLAGRHPHNICNKGESGKGVQLEITRGLRLKLFKGLRWYQRHNVEPMFHRFVEAVVNVLKKNQ